MKRRFITYSWVYHDLSYLRLYYASATLSLSTANLAEGSSMEKMVGTATRRLGHSGIEVSTMGLGCWAIGGAWTWAGVPVGWGETDDEESIRAIRAAIDLGVNYFDTADVYGCGRSERVLGKALAGRGDGIIVATKFGNVFDEEARSWTGEDVSPAAIRAACQASLKRLGRDRLDLY